MDSTPSILVETEEDFWRNKFYHLKSRYVNLKRESRERSSKARKLILATAIKLQEKENEIQSQRSKHDEELAEICRELTLLQSRMLFERKRISELLSERAEIRSKGVLSSSFRKSLGLIPSLPSSVVPLDANGSLLKSNDPVEDVHVLPEEDEDPIDCSTSILENLKRSMKIEDGKDSGRESDESLVLSHSHHQSSETIYRRSSPNSSFDSNDSYRSRKPPPPPPPRSIHTKLTTVPSIRKVQFSLSSPPRAKESPSTSVSYFEPYL